jgi:hypothetical protein
MSNGAARITGGGREHFAIERVVSRFNSQWIMQRATA